jgi:hypothetical protein
MMSCVHGFPVSACPSKSDCSSIKELIGAPCYEKCECGKHEFLPSWWDQIKGYGIRSIINMDPLEHQEIHQPGRNNGCLRYDFKERKYKPIG